MYRKFIAAVHEVWQKCSFKNLALEKKLMVLTDAVELKEAQLAEVIAASELDPVAVGHITNKLQVYAYYLL